MFGVTAASRSVRLHRPGLSFPPAILMEYRTAPCPRCKLASGFGLYGFEACSQADLAPNCSEIAAKCGVLSAD